MHRFALITVLFLATAAAAAPPVAPGQDRTITVSGYADTQVKPDHATVNIGVVTSDKVTTKALAANNELMARVVAAIRSLGIADSAMQTSHFSINAQHPILKDGYSPDLTVTLGYEVSNILNISVDDVSKVAGIIDAAVKAGANTSNSVDFDLKDHAALDDKMLAQAMKDARHNAEIMAAAEGVKVGKVISMNNVNVIGPIFGFRNHAPALAAAPMMVMPGEVDITAQVAVTYAAE